MTWLEKAEKVMLKNYHPFPVCFTHGKGVYLYDQEGKEYLDFMSGIAVNALGYQDEVLKEALINQLNKFTHCSNYYYNEPAIEAAERLVSWSGLDRVFFCNSGAEANEAAIKLARKYGMINKGEGCYKVISLQQSFHGRTLGALAATGQTKYQKSFLPMIAGMAYAPMNDIEHLKALIDPQVCGIIIEPIQGEGGIYPMDLEYLQEVRDICDQENIVLIFDEVQCGIGRTGKMFAFENYKVRPDILSLAKGLGAGVPIGAIVASEKVAVFEPGDHASTFGGNPLVTTAAKTVLDQIGAPEFLKHVQDVGAYLTEQLEDLVARYEYVVERRGLGLMQGIELNLPIKAVVQKGFEKQLLLTSAGDNVLRFVPPLIVTKTHIDEMIQRVEGIFEEGVYED